MEKKEFVNLFYPERLKWIDQQLKEGKEIADIFDLWDKLYWLKKDI